MSDPINLDEMYVYKFVRTDLPFAQHCIQLGHASWHAGKRFGAVYGDQQGKPFSIEVGMPDIKALNRVIRKLDGTSIGYLLFTDTDISSDPTALVTAPVNAETRELYFRNYRLYSAAMSGVGK